MYKSIKISLMESDAIKELNRILLVFKGKCQIIIAEIKFCLASLYCFPETILPDVVDEKSARLRFSAEPVLISSKMLLYEDRFPKKKQP